MSPKSPKYSCHPSPLVQPDIPLFTYPRKVLFALAVVLLGAAVPSDSTVCPDPVVPPSAVALLSVAGGNLPAARLLPEPRVVPSPYAPRSTISLFLYTSFFF